MMREFQSWLGKERLRWLIGLLIATGIASLILQVAFPSESWSLSVQTALVLIFLAGAFYIVSGRLSPEVRRRTLLRIAPSMLAVALGIVLPNFFNLFLGAALGWLIVAQVMIRDTMQQEYKQAVKAMRRGEYKKAIGEMTSLIKRENDQPMHYVFRAQLYRLNNDLKRAGRDYENVIQLDPESGVGQNGLAEINLHQGNLPVARKWSEEAYAKASDDWVAVYNLGMIAERQGDDPVAEQYLSEALERRLPDSRHRLLTKLWLAKVYVRQGKTQEAEAVVKQLKDERAGLKEWKTILKSDEARTLRHLLEVDVQAAEALMQGASLAEVFDAQR